MESDSRAGRGKETICPVEPPEEPVLSTTCLYPSEKDFILLTLTVRACVSVAHSNML
jgi:hypothetical protein